MMTYTNAAQSMPNLDNWVEALREGHVWGSKDILLQTYAAISGGLTEMAPDLDEVGSAYAPLVNQQVQALEAGIVGLIQTLMLVDAEQTAKDS